MPNGLTMTVDSGQLVLLLEYLATNINYEKVAGCFALFAGVCVGLVFLWWGVRKITSMLMAAFKNGKLSI